MKVLPYGERGTYVDLEAGDAADRSARTRGLARRLRAAFPEADVVCGAGVVAVFGAAIDDVRASIARGVRGSAPPAPADDARGSIAADGGAPTLLDDAREHVIPVVYDGPDLDEVAARIGASREDVIALHAGRSYEVELVGFLPGFAYAGPLDPRLVIPRRPAPRPRVSAQSVAIAGAFTGVYPLASPGGWNLLGTSVGPLPFDPSRDAPFLFAPGDRVRFVPVTSSEAPPEQRPARGSVTARADELTGAPQNGRGAPPNAWDPNDSTRPALIVARPPGLATVQDGGRLGMLSRGMPPSGPLDPELFSAANRAVGNVEGAAAIELVAGSLSLLARGDVAVSIDGAPALLARDGEALRVPEPERAVRYVAVSGGVDCPIVVGARATLLGARVGGVEGRALRRGDVIPARSSAGPLAPSRARLDEDPPLDATAIAPIEVDPGPHVDRFPAGALDVLLASEWRLSRLVDRTGARLEGGRVPRSGPDLAAPVPMRRGAVQITTDGTPIVLGPDHPTTGGYPVLAVVRAASFGALAQRRPGDAVRFRLAPPAG